MGILLEDKTKGFYWKKKKKKQGKERNSLVTGSQGEYGFLWQSERQRHNKVCPCFVYSSPLTRSTLHSCSATPLGVSVCSEVQLMWDPCRGRTPVFGLWEETQRKHECNTCKDMQVRWTDYSKFPAGVSVCLSVSQSSDEPVTCPGCFPTLLHSACQDGLQSPMTLNTNGKRING